MGNFVEAKEYLLENLLAQNIIFEVPVYQRPYSWGFPQWEDLFNDITNLEDGQIHFIGAIVVVPKSQAKILNEFSLVDGQQRLTTLFLWLTVIRDILEETNKETNKDLISNLNHYLFIEDFDDAKKKINPRLILGRSDKDCFENLLYGERDKLLDVKSAILDCYNFFKEKTIGSELKTWKKILKGISIVYINAYTNINAFRLFETLNDRGLELSAVDLIKNHILMKLSETENDFDSGLSKWVNIYETIKDFEPVRFLRRFYQIYFEEPTTERDLYEKFCQKIAKWDSTQILSLLETMNNYARIYNKMLVCNYDHPEINRKLTDFKYIEVTQSFAVLMLLLNYYHEKKLNRKDLIEIFEVIENLHIRWGICGISTARLDSIYNELCVKLKNFTESNLKDNTITYLYSKINEFVDNKIFEQNFLTKEVKPSEKRTRYILWKLMEPSGEQTPNFDKVQVEHIMPQNPSPTWLELLSKNMNLPKTEVLEMYAKYVNKIGNLTLIKGEWNQANSNKPFKDKKIEYSKSEFSHTRDLCNYDTWDFNTIEERTKLLAKIAVENIWKTKETRPQSLYILETDIPQDEYLLLIETLRKLKVSREWLIYYSDLAQQIINKYSLDFNKQFMTYSILKFGKLAILINDRYVYTLRKNSFVSLILPLDFDEKMFPNEKINSVMNFTSNKIPEAKWVRFDKTNSIGFPKEIIEQWELMVELEVSKNYKSPFKRFNKIALYKFFVDKDFRTKVLDKVYGSNF